MSATQVIEHIALEDRKERLCGHILLTTEFAEARSAPLEPRERASVCLLRRSTVAAAGRTFVECHDDIRTEGPLNVHHRLRRESVAGPVDVASEFNSVVVDLPDPSEREDLKSALSVRIGPSQRMKSWSPPRSRTSS